MYQVLARKYRPQKFLEVVGQDHVTQTLKNAIAVGRVHHAYLFVGVRGTGKTTVARILAKALNCATKTGDEPCGECSSCKEITAGTSLDVLEIDGASNTGVDNIRELRENVRFLPSSGKYKIYIIDEVHMLSSGAFNALLKTLEEPPAHIIFMFATTEAHKIPATILSRCQRYDFRRISTISIAATLGKIAQNEKIDANEDALHLIAKEATGSLRDAESLLDQAIAFSGSSVNCDTLRSMLGFLDRKLLFDLINSVASHDSKKALSILDELFATGADLVRFAMEVLEVFRHMLVLKECGSERGFVDVPPDELNELKKIASNVSLPELHQMFSVWYKVAGDIAGSPFPKMLLEVWLIRLCRIEPVKSIEEIVAKIDSVIGASVSPPLPNPLPQGERELRIPSREREPVASAPKSDNVKWEEFLRWVCKEKPKEASVFQSGVFSGIENNVVKLKFDKAFHFCAEMLLENDRRPQIEAMLVTFFKKPMRLEVIKTGETENANAPTRAEIKKEVVREVLSSDMVRQAADILNAEVSDVKVRK